MKALKRLYRYLGEDGRLFLTVLWSILNLFKCLTVKETTATFSI